MQGAGTFRGRRLIFNVIAVIILIVLITADQITKYYFSNSLKYGERHSIIDNFFYFTYTVNSGAAWSFLSDVSWAQTFFKVLTSIALVLFALFYLYAGKKGYKWLRVAIVFVIGGTIGNFIDRLILGGVVDFIGFTFGTYNFPIFNLADSFLTVGVIMIIVHYLFLDDSALFGKKNGKTKNSDN